MELRGKTVLVTGASRGIGRALAGGLVVSGCNLLLTAVEEDELSIVSAELQKNSSLGIDMMACDLTQPGEHMKLIAWVEKHVNPPDILVNNAGLGHFKRFENSTWDNIKRTLNLNVYALVHLTYKLIPVLRGRPLAKIVNISSGIARLPYPGLAVYGGTKGFISSLSESLSCELHGSNISVLCFHPGFTATSFISSAGMDLSRVPKRMIYRPEDIASQIIRAVKKDKQWAYSDFKTRFAVALASIIPARLKTSIFRNMFWRMENEK